MEKKADKIIRGYFGKQFSVRTRKLFARWFLASGDGGQKAATVGELWNESGGEINGETFEVWKALEKGIPELAAPKRPLLLSWLHYAAAVLLVAVSSAATYLLTVKGMHWDKNVEVVEMEHVFVPFGDDEYVILADGTEVWLNAGSFITYLKGFTSKERCVYLSGEARFNVAKNPGKPFVVKTNLVDIEALGTLFSVQAYPNENHTSATLENGSIAVKVKDGMMGAKLLVANEQFFYEHDTRIVSVKKVDAGKKNLWCEGYMIFENSEFAEIMATIGRKFNVDIFYDTSKYRSRYNVRFEPNETLDDIMEVLQQLIGIRYTIADKKIYIK